MPSKLLERLVTQRKELSDTLTQTLVKVEERAAETGDDRLTDTEQKNYDDAKVIAAQLDERIKELTEMEEREAAAAAVAVRALPKVAEVEERAGQAGGAKVRSEPSAYSPNGAHSWVIDALAIHHRHMVPGLSIDADAGARMERHAREVTLEQRDTTTTTYASLVPPQFLLDEFTINLRAGRPFANVCTGMPLPPQGMVMTIPRATAATTVSIQATQNTNPTTTDMAVTDLNVSVATFTGRGVISRQAMERGGVSLDRIVFNDLAADAARLIDQQALFGTGASGQMLGAITTGGIIAISQTATTGLDTLKAIANAIQSINTQRFLPPDVIIMHPRRWGALTIAVDTSNRPLVTVEAGQMNVFGQGEAALTQQVVGSALGLPIVTDPNLRTNLGAGTNQDEILVARRGDIYLWENGDGSPREFTFEQPVGPASVQLAVYGNAAFTAARYPTAVAYISGVGLVPPTF
jgi:HK97 family phage major capsid protein